MPDSPRPPRWYHETWAIVVSGLLCPPVAVYLVLKKPGLSAGARTLVICAMGAVVGSLALLELFGGVLGAGFARYRAFMLHQRAAFLERSGQTAAALDTLLEAWQLAPYEAELALDAATLATRLGRRAQAASLLTAIKERTDEEVAATAGLAALWLDDPKDYDRGKRFLAEAIDTHRLPADNPDALVLQARVEIQSGDLRSAEYHLRQVVAQFRRDQYDKVYRHLADIARRRGEPMLEIQLLCESLRSSVSQPEVRARLDAAVAAAKLPAAPYRAFVRALELHERLTARDEARALLDRVLARHPAFLYRDGCHYALATHHFYYKHDYRAALAHYAAIVKSHPASESYARALFQSGQCHEKLGQDGDAERAYRKLTEVAPAGTALYRMAALQLTRMRRIGRIGAAATEGA